MNAAAETPRRIAPDATAPSGRSSTIGRLGSSFLPPLLPPTSRSAFRFHMAYALLDALSAGIMSNAPLMAVKAMNASDAQLQLPQAMASIGLFIAVFSGVFMSDRRKKPFVILPGFAEACAILVMPWMPSAGWFLAAAGVASVFEFCIRPAVPSIVRILYPENCRSHVSGTLRQYASIVFLSTALGFSWFLSAGGAHIRQTIQIELTIAGLASVAAFACFRKLPDEADGSPDEAHVTRDPWRWTLHKEVLTPWRDRRFRRYLSIFFLYCFANLLYTGIVPAFFARELGLGYVEATLLMHIVPALTGFLAGGRLTAWFDRTSIWRSFSVVALLWGLDPTLLAAFPFAWPALLLARVVRGPATVGSMVLTFFTGIHSFARPGRDTSCYVSAQFLVNGVARLFAPTIVALMAGSLSHRTILLTGGLGVLAAAALFRLNDGFEPEQPPLSR